MLCIVLVGNTGYRGIQSIVNEDGSDGTALVTLQLTRQQAEDVPLP